MRIACFIFGSPGSGKTYITKYINKLLGLGNIDTFNMSIDERVSKIDEYKKKLTGKIKSSDSNDVDYLSELSATLYYKIRRIHQDKLLNSQINELKQFIKKPNCLVTIEATAIKEDDTYQCNLQGTYLELLKDAGFNIVFLYLYNSLDTIKSRIEKRNKNVINSIRNNEYIKDMRLVSYANILKMRDIVLDTIKYLLCEKRDNNIIILYKNKLLLYYNSDKNVYKYNAIDEQPNDIDIKDIDRFKKNIKYLTNKIKSGIY